MLEIDTDAINIGGNFFGLNFDDAVSCLVGTDNVQLQNFKALEGQIVQLELLAGDLLHEKLSDLGIGVLGRGEFSASLAPGEEHLLVRSDGRHIH
jgi:hypothetical protein